MLSNGMGQGGQEVKVGSFTDAQIAQILAEAKAGLVEGAINATRERVASIIRHTVEDEIKVTVAKFVKEEIVPQVAETLQGARAQIIEGIATAAVEIGKTIVQQMVSRSAKNLGSDYTSRKVLEELFK